MTLKSESSVAAATLWRVAALAVGLSLAGCGQKGPLTLPAVPAAASAPAR
jgi:predicted small lipoprotein YifL